MLSYSYPIILLHFSKCKNKKDIYLSQFTLLPEILVVLFNLESPDLDLVKVQELSVADSTRALPFQMSVQCDGM